MMTLLKAGPSFAGLPLSLGLLAWWNLDEASGNRLDSSGNGNTLTSSGSVGAVAGKIGNAADFSGEDEQLTRAALVTSGSFSFAGWVLPGDAASIDIVAQATAGAVRRQRLILSEDACVFYVSAALTVEGGVGLTIGEWMHLAGTYDGTTAKIYQNGVIQGSLDLAADFTGVSLLWVGDLNAQVPHAIDLVGVWNRALTATEIARLYNGGAGFDPTA